jgi:hypothetical protein
MKKASHKPVTREIACIEIRRQYCAKSFDAISTNVRLRVDVIRNTYVGGSHRYFWKNCYVDNQEASHVLRSTRECVWVVTQCAQMVAILYYPTSNLTIIHSSILELLNA